MIRRHAIRTRPHVCRQIFVRVIDAGIEHGYHEIFSAGRRGPSECGADVSTFLAAFLPGIGKCPLVFKLRIVWQYRHQWSFGFIEIDLEVWFGVFDFRKFAVLGNDARRVGVIEIVDGFDAAGILDSILDAIVEACGQCFDSFVAHAAFEFNQHFRTAEAARFAQRDLVTRGRLFLLSSGHDVHPRFPLFPPTAQLSCESSDENENECEREVYEKVIAVHGGTSI